MKKWFQNHPYVHIHMLSKISSQNKKRQALGETYVSFYYWSFGKILFYCCLVYFVDCDADILTMSHNS